MENYYYQQDQYLNNNNEGIAGVEYLDSFPPGFRFTPTDRELVVYYLMKKVNDEELPPNRIHVAKLYNFHPKKLAESFMSNEGHEWFFFTPRTRKYRNGTRPRRDAGNGYWKATGKDKPIKDFRGVEVGYKKTLVYYDGNPPKGVKSNWIMQEYRVQNSPQVERGPNDNMQLDKWVLCRIYQKGDKRGRTKIDNQSRSQSPLQSSLPAEDEIPSVIPLHQQDITQIVPSETPTQLPLPVENEIFSINYSMEDYEIYLSYDNCYEDFFHPLLSNAHAEEIHHGQVPSHLDCFAPAGVVAQQSQIGTSVDSETSANDYQMFCPCWNCCSTIRN